MKELLMSQTTEENRKLNSYGDVLVGLLHKSKLSKHDKTTIACLNIQFDNLQEILGCIDAAILSCYDDKELLTDLIPYINDASFMIASFIGKVMELKESV